MPSTPWTSRPPLGACRIGVGHVREIRPAAPARHAWRSRRCGSAAAGAAVPQPDASSSGRADSAPRRPPLRRCSGTSSRRARTNAMVGCDEPITGRRIIGHDIAFGVARSRREALLARRIRLSGRHCRHFRSPYLMRETAGRRGCTYRAAMAPRQALRRLECSGLQQVFGRYRSRKGSAMNFRLLAASALPRGQVYRPAGRAARLTP